MAEVRELHILGLVGGGVDRLGDRDIDIVGVLF